MKFSIRTADRPHDREYHMAMDGANFSFSSGGGFVPDRNVSEYDRNWFVHWILDRFTFSSPLGRSDEFVDSFPDEKIAPLLAKHPALQPLIEGMEHERALYDRLLMVQNSVWIYGRPFWKDPGRKLIGYGALESFIELRQEILKRTGISVNGHLLPSEKGDIIADIVIRDGDTRDCGETTQPLDADDFRRSPRALKGRLLERITTMIFYQIGLTGPPWGRVISDTAAPDPVRLEQFERLLNFADDTIIYDSQGSYSR